MQRREFIETAALMAGLPQIFGKGLPSEKPPKRKHPMPGIQDKQTVLFQGDSITDAGRDRDQGEDLGSGYAMMISAWISASHPERNIQFLNRGISGNRVKDLQARWKEDCLGLKPDWISILVGVNDTWRRYDSNDPTSAADYERGYRDLLDQIQGSLKAKIILCEPFLLHISEHIAQMREDLDPKIAVVHKLASEYKTKLVPLDQIFKNACKHRKPAFWAADGVHPTSAGHALISQNWIDAVSRT
jgi:lysophospholipase L1-like esterase